MLDRSIVIKGGILIDGTGKQPIPNSLIVISGSKIIDVGSAGEVTIPKYAEIIDAAGKTVIPCFIDSHTHFILMGVRTLTTLDLSKTKSISEVVDQVKKRLTELPKGAWLTGHGWDESGWNEKRYPTKNDLDQFSPENPVVLTPYYGHMMTVNTRALELAKITKETPDPSGGKIDRDPATNEATGILREEAMELIEAVKPPTTKEASLLGIKKACEIVLSWGCASIHELGSDSIDINAYQTALEKGMLKIRTYVMPTIQFNDEMLDGLETLGIRTRFGDDFLRIGSVKIFLDGSMGARTAAFSEPYADEPSTRGIFTISTEELEQRVKRAHELGMQVAIHAIGDRGIEKALNAIEAALEREPRKNHRHRIEHCEVLTENQILRIKRLGIVPSMQPNFIGEWGQPGGMYEQRLGSNRLRLNNPYRRMIDEGITVAFGSDCGYCPPWPFNPLYGLWSAVNHPIKENRISLEEAVKCYTLNGAHASFEENIKGTIEPGKLADITILSENLISIPTMNIKDVKVEMTMINGRIQWRAR
ncbi:MAG: amidohydrolase [Candidatus Hodarchaeales archaeon]|jgi:predicted amidohydrolase YtcJ